MLKELYDSYFVLGYKNYAKVALSIEITKRMLQKMNFM